MSTYVMSDIHGQGALFHEMLEKIGFSCEDTLFILGDVIDRGPDGISLLREIMHSSNMILMLGNHEHMMMRYFAPDVTDIEIHRWEKNGNGPTLDAWKQLGSLERAEILGYLSELPVQKRIRAGEKDFFLVHGFPADTAFEAVWGRPQPDAENPVADTVLIIGHTPVMYMLTEKENVPALVEDMISKGLHPRIYHGSGFLDIDCGCSFRDHIKTLACLRLEDMVEFYVWNPAEAMVGE